MASTPTPLRIGAVALAVTLAASYIWFRVAQAEPDRSADATPATKPSTTASDVRPEYLLPSSKSGAILRSRPATTQGTTSNLHYTYDDPSPQSKPPLFYGSKSGAVDLIPHPTTSPTK